MKIYEKLQELTRSGLIEMPSESAVPNEPSNFVYVDTVTTYGLDLSSSTEREG